jgi:hypothetical protein
LDGFEQVPTANARPLFCCRGLGTNAFIREARVSKPCVWRWQQAYMEGGVERLSKEKGKGPKAGKTRVSEEVRLAIVTRTASKRHKLERAYAGRGDRGRPHDSTAHLEGTRPVRGGQGVCNVSPSSGPNLGTTAGVAGRFKRMIQSGTFLRSSSI